MALLNTRASTLAPAAARTATDQHKDDQTSVELLHIKGRVERWIRFGQNAGEQLLDRRRKRVSFAPGSVFALVRWSANDFGTVVSRLYVLRAVATDEPFTTVPDVDPGGELLLRVSGWPKVRHALEAIDAVEALGLAPERICPDYWRQVGSRLAAGKAPEPYRRDRHRAWLLRKEIGR